MKNIMQNVYIDHIPKAEWTCCRALEVAGATLMALGCNGPELSLNTIAIYQPSNIGVGAVIGGEVFNVLVIIGSPGDLRFLALKLTGSARSS